MRVRPIVIWIRERGMFTFQGILNYQIAYPVPAIDRDPDDPDRIPGYCPETYSASDSIWASVNDSVIRFMMLFGLLVRFPSLKLTSC